ncbi:hypothetical protein PIB30_022992 [Stylosanthes scabra]|uniref:BZIP domain-containing protein n=1 Tax=Stylosanthes scabra TaxID=79078 RepID=A0ABU6U9T7_9FABA|nr:hypothetical protein [Stylosanthes scabra]
MASPNVVTTHPDLPRDSSLCSISTLLADAQGEDQEEDEGEGSNNKAAMEDFLNSIYSSNEMDQVWKDMVGGTSTEEKEKEKEMTLEDYLRRGKRKGGVSSFPVPVEVVDKAILQKHRRMIKNRESAARSRERKQAYTLELESLVLQLEAENARLLQEQAQIKKQRYNQLMESIIPVHEKRKPRPMLRRLNSLQW